MRKLFILCALVVTGIASYAFGYSYFSFDQNLINLKGRDYVMPETTPTEENIEEESKSESVDIIYSINGNAITYNEEYTTDNGEE